MGTVARFYSDDAPVRTYLETHNLTIYAQGPTGVEPFADFFKKTGTQATLAFAKPFHWVQITKKYFKHTHILVIQEPVKHHLASSAIHIKTMPMVERKRNNLFYYTHLAPYLSTCSIGEFDHYIHYDKLEKYLFDWEKPQVEKGPNLFDVSQELEAYKWIKSNKMSIDTKQWRELIMRGQLEEI